METRSPSPLYSPEEKIQPILNPSTTINQDPYRLDFDKNIQRMFAEQYYRSNFDAITYASPQHHYFMQAQSPPLFQMSPFLRSPPHRYAMQATPPPPQPSPRHHFFAELYNAAPPPLNPVTFDMEPIPVFKIPKSKSQTL